MPATMFDGFDDEFIAGLDRNELGILVNLVQISPKMPTEMIKECMARMNAEILAITNMDDDFDKISSAGIKLFIYTKFMKIFKDLAIKYSYPPSEKEGG